MVYIPEMINMPFGDVGWGGVSEGGGGVMDSMIRIQHSEKKR
jgi:hypothetical protein